MHESYERRLAWLASTKFPLASGQIGLEKESLRVAADGLIAQTPHPDSLGRPLTHPSITTDFAEPLLELVTEPYADSRDALHKLDELHRFIHLRLDDELLWPASMPCVVEGEPSIPIARFGESNEGKFKEIYRRGLGHRYGKLMQVIAGVHFNYSVPPPFWPAFAEREGFASGADLQTTINDKYFGLIRNAQRFGWILLYLFGASPAVCRSFVKDRPHALDQFDKTTLYQPFATSLRMSDLGYSNRKRCGLTVSYDNLSSYTKSLRWALSTSCLPYEIIGVEKAGEFLQLNSNVLQIENEYYSGLRPKQPPRGPSQTPLLALLQQGVRYVELRTIDLNPFEPVGVNGLQLRFLEAFLLYCLLTDGPPINAEEEKQIDANQLATALRGREPGLKLRQPQGEISLQQWAGELCDSMQGLCELLDNDGATTEYSAALRSARDAIAAPELTPSARLLETMRSEKIGFFHVTRQLAEQHRDALLKEPLAGALLDHYDSLAVDSIARQKQIEATSRVPFGEYLSAYQEAMLRGLATDGQSISVS